MLPLWALSLALLKGQEAESRDLFWHYPHYHGSNWRPGAAIRSGNLKLIEFYPCFSDI